MPGVAGLAPAKVVTVPFNKGTKMAEKRKPSEVLSQTDLDVRLENKDTVELGGQRRAVRAEIVVESPEGEELIRDTAKYRLDERKASQGGMQSYFDLRKASAVRAAENKEEIDLEALS